MMTPTSIKAGLAITPLLPCLVVQVLEHLLDRTNLTLCVLNVAPLAAQVGFDRRAVLGIAPQLLLELVDVLLVRAGVSDPRGELLPLRSLFPTEVAARRGVGCLGLGGIVKSEAQ